MVFTIPDQAVWFTVLAWAFYFSFDASRFPYSVARGEKVPAGEVWWYVRGIVYPFLAGGSWQMFAGFAIAAGNNGTNLLYYFSTALFLMFYIMGLGMLIYLAYHPIVRVLAGRERLDST